MRRASTASATATSSPSSSRAPFTRTSCARTPPRRKASTASCPAARCRRCPASSSCWTAWSGAGAGRAGNVGAGENVAHTLRELGLAERLTRVVRSDQVPRGKPHPDVFLEAARVIGAPPERCVAFEDAPMGVKAAPPPACTAWR
jgi:hypothetical protein